MFTALFIQNANLMRRHYKIFVHYLINGKNKVIEHKMCVVVVLQLLSEIFLILIRI